MTRSELERRQTVWNALSKFYLDNQLDNQDYDDIVETFSNSGFSLNEIKNIDRDEVFPILHTNLLSPAGVWNGFDEEWLYESCLRNYKKRKNVVFRIMNFFQNRMHNDMTKEQWMEIEKRMV